jgi:hypothetical protein
VGVILASLLFMKKLSDEMTAHAKVTPLQHLYPDEDKLPAKSWSMFTSSTSKVRFSLASRPNSRISPVPSFRPAPSSSASVDCLTSIRAAFTCWRTPARELEGFGRAGDSLRTGSGALKEPPRHRRGSRYRPGVRHSFDLRRCDPRVPC